LTIEITGSQEKLAAMIEMLSRYGIREMVQSGVVAMARGPRSMTQTSVRSVGRTA
jgi:acetolactate synthase-1/3 small subunit